MAPRKPKAVVPTGEVEVVTGGGTEAAAPAAEAPVKPSKTSITIKYRDHVGSEASRTFSKEVHGEDFAKLADEFRTTNAGKIIE